MIETAAQTNERSEPSQWDMLRGTLAGLRRRHVTVQVLTGLALTLILCIEILAVAMFVDWWVELPWAVRLISLLAQGSLFIFLLTCYVIVPLLRQPDEDELALMVEKARPEFRSRLIAAIQLRRAGAVPAGASKALVDALVAETEQVVRGSDFRPIISAERLRKFGAMAVFILGIAVSGFIYGGDTSNALLQRTFLASLPVPRKTQVIVPEGNRVVGLGDSVRLDAFVRGIIPSHGMVEVHQPNRRLQVFSLEQARENPAHFARLLEKVQDSFDYQFSLGDGVSDTFRITAIPRPTVAEIACEQVFPGYTGLPVTQRNLGDLTLLAGSVLRLKVTATKEINRAKLRFVGLDKELPMQVNPENPRELKGQLIVPETGLNGFQVDMLDIQNMRSRDSAVYRIDLIRDNAPVVRLTYPERKEELLTRQATMLLAFEVSDDFEVAHLRLKYKVDTLDEGAEKVIDLDLEGAQRKQLRRRYHWELGKFIPPLAEGSTIEYWLEAEDNNDTTGPGISTCDHRLARIVSEAEKRTDLLNRAGDYLGSISDLVDDQERLNRDLGEIIRAKAGLR
jgi:hypothetical protein